MTVKELKELFKQLPADTQIVVSASDHTYRAATILRGTRSAITSPAWQTKTGELFERYDADDIEGCRAVDVLVLG